MEYEKIDLGNAKDLTGKRFDRLVALYRTKNKGNKVAWCCQCDCGNKVAVIACNLTMGRTKSCGCLNDELKRSRFKDLTGQRFGKLVAIKPTEKRTQHNNIIWECKCDCGKIVEKNSHDLLQGHIKSCGCLIEDKIIDLTGQKFGLLTALRWIHKNNKVYWICKCDCGNIVEVNGDSLRRGKTQSCGCWQKIVAKQSGINNRIDISGQKFGKLTALYPINVGKNENNGIIWRCKCDCGNECDVLGYLLRKGETTSCGCLLSKGEEIIKQLLNENHINFETQKTFNTCINPKTQRKLRFDFYVNQQYLIEFDGIQHYKSTHQKGEGWNTEEYHLEVKDRDNIKNQWCKKNNIPLIRIPYTHLKELSVNDLLLETSNYIVNI